MQTFELDWKPTSNLPYLDVGVGVANLITNIIKTQLPEYLPHFPFQNGYFFEGFYEADLAFFQLINREITGHVIPSIGHMKDGGLIERLKEIHAKNNFPSFRDVYDLDNQLFSPEKVTYIGSQKDMTFSWTHIEQYLVEYLNSIVLPDVMEKNKKRVYDAIPQPPRYDIQKILNNIYIIESPKMAVQGTCFYTQQYGFITCDHCAFDDSVVYRANDINKKYSIKILKQNSVIDLAIFEVSGIELDSGLTIGNSDDIVLNDNVAAAGFPNHNFGDSGIFSPGLVVGFRPVASIRRILVNIPLIAGNSGGPIISSKNEVIGIAVTGADKMQNAGQTEEHGVVPLSAILFV